MKQFWVITSWEFLRHFKSRSFLLATFVSPIIFAMIILLPPLFLDHRSEEEPYIIGCVEFDSTQICEEIKARFLESLQAFSASPALRLSIINPDTSEYMKNRFLKEAESRALLDSLDDAYNKIKERRKYIFQKPKTESREKLLKQTYESLIQTREARDLALLDYQKTKAENDSLWRMELIRKADNLLQNQHLDGYLLIEPEAFSDGIVEFHSFLPASFLQMEPMKQVLQVVVVESRMEKEGIRVDKIQEWLKPVEFREIQLQGGEKQEFDFMVNYLGPIIVVLFLFISIFTSSGFLFSGVLKEKMNRVIEILLSSVNHRQLIAGKILGLGILGIFQILIWYSITLILLGFDVLDVGEVGFLTVRNAALFVIYFILGYLFFASVFVGIGSLFSSEDDAHHLNQFMRMLSIFPIVMALLVLETPNALYVRLLSFIPPLTPTFMILRTPLGNPPSVDYYISIGVMVVSIGLSILFAGRLFKMGSLLYGKRPTPREILNALLRSS